MKGSEASAREIKINGERADKRIHLMLPRSKKMSEISVNQRNWNKWDNYCAYAGGERSRNGECGFDVVETKIGLFPQGSSRDGGLSKAQLHLSPDIVDE